MARGGRRRRVLNDEVRSASGANASAYVGGLDPDAPRYGEQANIENHPQVTDFVPRRKLAVLTTLLAGAGTAAAAAAIAHYAEPISARLPGVAASDLSDGLAWGVTAWSSAIAFVMIAMMAKLTYSLRRHRVDDYAGRYRVWKWIGWGALAASINAVTPMHTLFAKAAANATGWSMSATGAEWWLAPLALVGGWIFVRLLLEINESRPATAFTLCGAACYAVGSAAAIGWAPSALGSWSHALGEGMPLVGTTFGLAGMMVFARYVVLDVQGLIDHSRPVVAEKPAKPEKAEAVAPVPAAVPVAAAPAIVAESTSHHEEESHDDEWADADEDDDEFGNRKLSKAEKKRLRRQNRAA